MAPKLADEIKMSRGFVSLEQEAALNLARTTDHLGYCVGEVLRREGLSAATYNVVRILRGAGPDGLPCGEIGGRMLTRVPDVTRLVDRLEERGLVARRRVATDRRVVRVVATESGVELLDRLDAPMLEIHRRQLGHMGKKKLKLLIELLEEARSGAEAPCPEG